jgi:flagellar L-ring protein precursor FlgH
MKTNVFAAAVLFALCAPAFAQEMRENAMRSLFSDQKASRIGDAVTILIMENASGSNDASTNTSRESALSLTAAGKAGKTTLPDVSASIGTGNSFKGEGATTAKGNVRAKISAHVDSINRNGNLFVSGSRTITVNGEEQLIEVVGVIRQSDIQADNTVYSYNISDARIVYRGNGIVSDKQESGWITRLFHWLF